jgi:Amt family ammonium transporter
MLFIKYVCRIPLRMSEEQLIAGDDMVHGEAAYVFGPCEAHEHLLAGHYIKRSETGPGELGMGGVTIGQDPHASHGIEKSSGSGSNDVKHD